MKKKTHTHRDTRTGAHTIGLEYVRAGRRRERSGGGGGSGSTSSERGAACHAGGIQHFVENWNQTICSSERSKGQKKKCHETKGGATGLYRHVQCKEEKWSPLKEQY